MIRYAASAVVMLVATLTGSPVGTAAQDQPAPPVQAEGRWAEYVGRYALSDDLILNVREAGELLELLPTFWRTPLILDPVGDDTFVALRHRQMRFEFERGGEADIVSLVATGNPQIDGRAGRLSSGERLPVELLLAGQPDAALQQLELTGGLGQAERATNLGFEYIRNYPTRAEVGATFLESLAGRFDGDLDFQIARAMAWMQAGDRTRALASFDRADAIAPDNALVQRALRHLAPERSTPPPESAWSLPFSLTELFRTPTETEIAAVRRNWSQRDLEPTDWRHEASHVVTIASIRYEARVVSHLVHGTRHFGAVMVPLERAEDCCHVILELHGIDDRYSGFDLEDLRAPHVLREEAGSAILVVPAFRGESLRVEDAVYESDGDPRDGWDGATDDAIALLSVALEAAPETEARRICAFGKSRGATVALLAGIRDARIGCVVAWAGPAEWLGQMGTFGWTLPEQVEWALWERWTPGSGWGSAAQFIDWFLAESIASGAPGVESVRRHILASSPLYFLEDLPPASVHYGAEDRAVPIRNAEALRRSLRASSLRPPARQVWIHPESGHDMPFPRAYDLSRDFLLEHLRGPARP